MGVQIRIVPDALRNAAEKQHMIANHVGVNRSELKQVIHMIDEAWDGPISEEIQDMLRNVGNILEELETCYDDNAQRLNGILEAFEAIDSDEPRIRAVGLDRVFHLVGCPKPVFALSWKADRIRIIPDEIRLASERCREMRDSFVELEDKTMDVIHDLEANWEGNAYNKYREQTEDTIKTLKDVQEFLAETADTMSKAAIRYEEWDNSF